jgi:hypothetical protein
MAQQESSAVQLDLEQDLIFGSGSRSRVKRLGLVLFPVCLFFGGKKEKAGCLETRGPNPSHACALWVEGKKIQPAFKS